MMDTVTEAEAAKKTCPHMTYCVNEQGVIADGNQPIHGQSQCIGSACMAWRWGNKFRDIPQPKKSVIRQVFEAFIFVETVMIEEIPQEERRGWCGLAGEP